MAGLGGRDGEVGCGLRKNVFRPFGPQFDPKARGTLPWIHRCSLHYGGLFCWVLVFSRPENKSTRGDTPGNSWWGCAVRFSKSRPSQTKKCHFHTRFHTFQTSLLKSIPVFRPGIRGNYFIIIKIRTPTKRFLKSISKSHIILPFWFIWNWKDKYVYTLPWFLRKPYSIPDRNGAKTIPFGAAHTYMTYVSKYPPPPQPPPTPTTRIQLVR